MMKTIRAFAVLTAVLLTLAPSANAQYEKTKSTLVVADRIEVPGAILEPGNYLVRIADQQSNRNVIVFQSADGTKTFATTIATPHRGAKAPTQSEFTFYATAAGEPRVLRSWFAHDDPNGQDFYYPAERAAQLKLSTHEDVPVASAEWMPASAPAPAPAAPVEIQAVRPEPPPAPAPMPAETVASNETTHTMEAETLPQTASPYPLVALLGVVSLAAAFVLGRRRETA